MTIFPLSHFFLDFRTIVGSYAIAGLHVLPVWLYCLQRLELIYMYFGSNAVSAITAILVSGRLTCFFVEVKLKIIVFIRTKATRNNSSFAHAVMSYHWTPSWLMLHITLEVYSEIVVSIYSFAVSFR